MFNSTSRPLCSPNFFTQLESGEGRERRGRGGGEEGKGGGRGGEKLYKFQVKEMEGFASCSKLLLLLQAYFQRLIHTQLLQPL